MKNSNDKAADKSTAQKPETLTQGKPERSEREEARDLGHETKRADENGEGETLEDAARKAR